MWIDQIAQDEDVKFICVKCGEVAYVRMNIVMQLDAMNDRNKRVPPHVRCKDCNQPMIPEKYIGIDGVFFTFEAYKDLID